MTIKAIGLPVLAGAITFGVLYGICGLSSVRALAGHYNMDKQLGELQGQLSASLSAAITGIVAALKRWFGGEGTEKTAAKPPELDPGTLNTPAPASANIDWQRAFENLRREAQGYISVRNTRIRLLGEELRESESNLSTSMERRGIVKFTLYGGLALAFGSCVATIVSLPKSGDVVESAANRHLLYLVAIYAGVSLVMAFSAMVIRGRPFRPVPLLTFALAALYVDTVAILISLPYTAERILSSKDHVHGMPMAAWIGLTRFVILPFCALVGSAIGSILGGMYPKREG